MKTGIKSYAENIKAMGLTDLEIFMKLQDDMHNSIEGYGQPRLDIDGHFGVDIAQEGATGTCRNMVDDIVRKLNAINPDYNARMFIVKALSGEYCAANIQRNDCGTVSDIDHNRFNDTQIREIVYKIEEITQDSDVFNVLGNHAVVAVDLIKDNITIIIDPTMTCLGVFKEGQITIFNSVDSEKPWGMYRTPLDDFAYRGIEALEVPFEYAKSFFNPYLSIDELNEKYGVEAQNQALFSAKKKEETYIYNLNKYNSFKNSLKVDLDSEKQSVYSVEEIEKFYTECIQSVYGISSAEEAIEVGNIYRKIVYSIGYYDQKQEEILGKSINYYATISKRLNLNMLWLRENIANKMIETNAVILPEDTEAKQFLCEKYLEVGEDRREQIDIQDLKVAVDKNENERIYYILNNDTLLGIAKISDTSMSYSSQNIKINSETKMLLENACSIIKPNSQEKNQIIEER